ncbi:MAG: hypothetical protein C4520_02140 [Candidatus Abyssobacteria bacterium SURF_5]|uniref:SSD domain-containing protein n=1 Tax=Abyssobacteria bacterium (strain SURF_5) TaxID=2093360 RepID=A0A3A4P4F0_ABYX5|nr:MAG: hypothetical protein C4520_02140 [Candidatus Abyssubacteria bacterium SURF_5]
MFVLYSRLITCHSRKILRALTCITIVMGIFVFRLETNNSIETWLLDDDPRRLSYEKFVEMFGTEEFVLVVYSDTDLFSRESFQLNYQISEKVESIEGVARVWSLSEVYRNIVSRLPVGAALPLHRFKEGVLGHPLFTGNLISDDGVTTAIVAVLTPDGTKDRNGTVRAIRQAAAEVCPDKDLRFAGPPVMSAELDRIARRDPRVFTPLVVIMAAGILLAMFHRPAGVRIPLAVAGMSIVWSLGIFSLISGTMNMVLAVMPPLVLVAAVGDSIHLLCRYRHHIRSKPPERAVVEAVRDVWRPCLMTSLTTAVGFGSLAVSHFSPVRSFGLVSMLGIAFAFVITMLLAPASIAFKRGAGLSAASEDVSPLNKILSFIKTVNARRPVWILSAFALLSIVGLLGIIRLNVEANTLKFFPADGEIRRTYKFIEENLTGLSPFEILLRGDELGEPATLAAIDRIQAYLAEQPHITHSFSVRSLQAGFATPHALAPASEGLRIAALFKDLEDSFINRERSATHISGRGLTMNSILYERAMDDIQSFVNAVLPEGITAELTGVVPLIASMDRYLLVTFMKSFAMALLIIGVIMSLNFRSIRFGLLSMIPNAIPIVAVLGLMGFLAIDLSPATVTVASVSLGLVVDDTIHYMHRYFRYLENGSAPSAAAAMATATVGAPAIYTTLVLGAGFIVMVVSDFGPTRLFGLLSVFSIMLALLCDLFLLPVLLVRFTPVTPLEPKPALVVSTHALEEYQDAS